MDSGSVLGPLLFILYTAELADIAAQYEVTLHACAYLLTYVYVGVVQLKELNHDNVKSFIGACIEPGHVSYVMQCCSRGTIQVCL